MNEFDNHLSKNCNIFVSKNVNLRLQCNSPVTVMDDEESRVISSICRVPITFGIRIQHVRKPFCSRNGRLLSKNLIISVKMAFLLFFAIFMDL